MSKSVAIVTGASQGIGQADGDPSCSRLLSGRLGRAESR